MHRSTLALSLARAQLKNLEQAKQTLSAQQLGPNHDAKMKSILQEIPVLENKLKEAQQKAGSAIFNSVQVLQRHHFSSKLQRMSVVCKCQNTANSKGE